uniref:RING-type domain-containing protein n=1 Tax=Moniliophthora roreri TaxID=221103 RepID=A0A0W0EZD7_MONRR
MPVTRGKGNKAGLSSKMSRRNADVDEERFAASSDDDHGETSGGANIDVRNLFTRYDFCILYGGQQMRIDSFFNNTRKLVKQEVQILCRENTRLRRQLGAQEESGSPRKRSSPQLTNIEVAELKEKVKELEAAREKDLKRIKSLEDDTSLKREVEDLLSNLDDTFSLSEEDDAYKMRKLLRRFSALMQERALVPAKRGDFCCHCTTKITEPENISSMNCLHIICDTCLPQISNGSDQSIICSTCDELTSRDELRLVHLTEAERWDELQTVAAAFMALDSGHRHEQDTTEEERSENFINDEEEESASTTLANVQHSSSEYRPSDLEDTTQEYRPMSPDQKRKFLRKRHGTKFDEASTRSSKRLKTRR